MRNELASQTATTEQALQISDKIALGSAVFYRNHEITGDSAKARGYGKFDVRNNIGKMIGSFGHIVAALDAIDEAHVACRNRAEQTVAELGVW